MTENNKRISPRIEVMIDKLVERDEALAEVARLKTELANASGRLQKIKQLEALADVRKDEVARLQKYIADLPADYRDWAALQARADESEAKVARLTAIIEDNDICVKCGHTMSPLKLHHYKKQPEAAKVSEPYFCTKCGANHDVNDVKLYNKHLEHDVSMDLDNKGLDIKPTAAAPPPFKSELQHIQENPIPCKCGHLEWDHTHYSSCVYVYGCTIKKPKRCKCKKYDAAPIATPSEKTKAFKCHACDNTTGFDEHGTCPVCHEEVLKGMIEFVNDLGKEEHPDSPPSRFILYENEYGAFVLGKEIHMKFQVGQEKDGFTIFPSKNCRIVVDNRDKLGTIIVYNEYSDPDPEKKQAKKVAEVPKPGLIHDYEGTRPHPLDRSLVRDILGDNAYDKINQNVTPNAIPNNQDSHATSSDAPSTVETSCHDRVGKVDGGYVTPCYERNCKCWDGKAKDHIYCKAMKYAALNVGKEVSFHCVLHELEPDPGLESWLKEQSSLVSPKFVPNEKERWKCEECSSTRVDYVDPGCDSGKDPHWKCMDCQAVSYKEPPRVPVTTSKDTSQK